MSTNPEGRAWIRVRADALRENYARIRRSVGSAVGIIPMVKADAYGLGVDRVVRVLAPEGPLGWGVATLAEGLLLRESGVKGSVIVLAPLPVEFFGEAIDADLELSISSLDSLDALVALGRSAAVHVDVDTGMGRTGFDWRDAPRWLPRVEEAARNGGVRWVGCFTHLHSADEDEASAREQWERFEGILSRIEEVPPGLLVHVLNSPGALRVPDLAHSAVRPGIFLYGGAAGRDLREPEPVVSLHARVVHVRDASPGTTLGYGATYTASAKERWATLSIGYGDGFPRALGNVGSALIDGHRVPVIGRISMDLTVVDVSGVSDVVPGDVATLIGKEGPDEITLDEVAELAGTISYEILTGLTQRLPRIWLGVEEP